MVGSEEIPAWFWTIAIAAVLATCTGLFSIVVYFITKFMRNNEESWNVNRQLMNDMITKVALLVQRTDDHQEDIKELKLHVHELPRR